MEKGKLIDKIFALLIVGVLGVIVFGAGLYYGEKNSIEYSAGEKEIKASSYARLTKLSQELKNTSDKSDYDDFIQLVTESLEDDKITYNEADNIRDILDRIELKNKIYAKNLLTKEIAKN